MLNPVNVVPVITKICVPSLVLDIVNVFAEVVFTKYTVSGITPQNVGSEKNIASPVAPAAML